MSEHEMVQKGNEQAQDEGIVYLLLNEWMPSVIKIGFTKDLAERMRSLDSSTSVPAPFMCVHASRVVNPRRWERTLHAVFDTERINSKRDFLIPASCREQ